MGSNPYGPRLTIGQAASHAGVTTRAIRHYHQLGLLPEPPRDRSGYRRYGARDVIALIRIRALAQAGVPLNRVGELLAADRDELAAAVADIDEQLRVEIERLELHRKAIAELTTIDGLALPDEVVGYLDALRALGIDERMVEIERDSWVIVSAQLPEHVAEWMTYKRASLDDPMFVASYHDMVVAFDLAPDDPRLEAIADRLAATFEHVAELAAAEGTDATDGLIDAETIAMLDAESIGRSPAWVQLTRLLEQRGWVGWSDVRQVHPKA